MAVGDSKLIKTLRVKNFKCFEDQAFDVGSLTLLSGLNGTGKSSVLQSVLLLRQSHLQGLLQRVGLSLNGDLVQLGTGRDVFFEGATSDEFGFDISFKDGMTGSWVFEYDREADVVRLASDPVSRRVFNKSLFSDDFHYLAAERIGPRTSFATSDYLVGEHHQLGAQGEYTSHFLSLFGDQKKVAGSALVHFRDKSMTLQRQVEAWMGEISPGVRIDLTSYPDIDLVSLQFSFVMGDQISNSYRSANVGFGITYTLPVVVALLSSAPGALVLLENPEAHLHPRGQVRMGELMARAATCGIQVVAESHSDHVLNGVRIAVRQGIVTPEQVQLYFFQRKPGQINSEIISPQLDRDGRIDHWPNGFFDEWERSLEDLL